MIQGIDQPMNLLPIGGEVFYMPGFLSTKEAKHLYTDLEEKIIWQHDEFFMYGKRIITKRKVAWYGSKAFQYTYSNRTRTALLWNQKLLEIKNVLESKTGENFNSCLLNLYPAGSDGMGWHSDDEKELKPLATIASLSLGSDRKFSFKHRLTKETVSLTLQNGSLLLMKGTTQKHWLHQLPKTKKNIGPRINLTFRSIIDTDELL